MKNEITRRQFVGATAVDPQLPDLTVDPAEPASLTGHEGGPFTPSMITYELSNIGPTALDWTSSAVCGRAARRG